MSADTRRRIAAGIAGLAAIGGIAFSAAPAFADTGSARPVRHGAARRPPGQARPHRNPEEPGRQRERRPVRPAGHRPRPDPGHPGPVSRRSEVGGSVPLTLPQASDHRRLPICTMPGRMGEHFTHQPKISSRLLRVEYSSTTLDGRNNPIIREHLDKGRSWKATTRRLLRSRSTTPRGSGRFPAGTTPATASRSIWAGRGWSRSGTPSSANHRYCSSRPKNGPPLSRPFAPGSSTADRASGLLAHCRR
jgi:hypothetical protein